MNKEEMIKQINNNVVNCTKCRLYKQAKNGVPGEGSINSEIVFIGEAPGAVEDDTGRPFVGRAGMLLERLLLQLGYKRGDVWIGNVLKHRPLGNRDPLPDEIRACAPYLNAQLKVINPVLIVTLGRFAMNYFYPEGKISRDRGRLVKTKNYFIYPLYHPAAGLRNAGMLGALKADFLRIPEVLEQVKSGEFTEEKEEEEDDGQLKLF